MVTSCCLPILPSLQQVVSLACLVPLPLWNSNKHAPQVLTTGTPALTLSWPLAVVLILSNASASVPSSNIGSAK